MTAPDGFPLDALDGPSGALGHSVIGIFPSVRQPVSYAVPCTAAFASAVCGLAARRGSDVSALASAALLLAPNAVPDPGVPDADDASATILTLWLATGLAESSIRRALAAALALADPQSPWRLAPAGEVARLEAAVEALGYRNKTLAQALERVSFRPLDGRVTQVRDAAQLFGFVNEWCFDEDRVVKRFRELAPVYHPDTGVVACRERMAQLIEARNLLIRHVRTAYSSGAWVRGRR